MKKPNQRESIMSLMSSSYDAGFKEFFTNKRNYELKKLKKFRIEKHISRKFDEMSAQRDQQFEDMGLM